MSGERAEAGRAIPLLGRVFLGAVRWVERGEMSMVARRIASGLFVALGVTGFLIVLGFGIAAAWYGMG